MAWARTRGGHHQKSAAAWILLVVLTISASAAAPCLTACPEEDETGCLAVCLSCGACVPPNVPVEADPPREALRLSLGTLALVAPPLLAGPPSEILHVPRSPSGL